MSLIERPAAPTKADATIIGTPNGLPIKNTSYVNIKATNLRYKDADYSYELDRAVNHNSKDGVYPMTPEEQQSERDVSWGLVKQFTKNIFSMNFTNFSFPVSYSEPRSFLERTADIFSFLGDSYIDKCFAEKDPDMKLMYLTAGIAGGFYIYMQSKKPWNPVLGETYCGKWQSGTTIYGEQTSHHPPISDVEIKGKDGNWTCSAHCQFTIDSGMREVDINQNGVFHLEFNDGNVYEWEFPVIQVFGIVYGDRILKVKGPVIVKDLKNGIEAKLEINPKKDKSRGIKESKATTIFTYTCLSNDTKREHRKVMRGDWTDKFTVDGVDTPIWDINRDRIMRPVVDADPMDILPSDCRFRLDRAFLIQENSEAADIAKTTIEVAQRREEKLRIKQ